MSFKCFVILLFCALYSWNTYGYSPDITYTPSFQRTPHRVQNLQMANYLNSKRPYPYMRPPIVQRVILKPLLPQSYYRNQPVIQDLPFNPNQRFNLGPVVNQNNLRVIPDVIAKVEKITSINPESSIKLKKQRESEDGSAEHSKEENESEEEDNQREYNQPKVSKSDKVISNHARPSNERIKKSTAKEEKVDHPEHHSPQPTNQWKKIKISPVRYEVKEQFEEIDNGGLGNKHNYETRITHSHGGDDSDWHKKKGEKGDKESITDHHEERSSKSKDGSGHEKRKNPMNITRPRKGRRVKNTVLRSTTRKDQRPVATTMSSTRTSLKRKRLSTTKQITRDHTISTEKNITITIKKRVIRIITATMISTTARRSTLRRDTRKRDITKKDMNNLFNKGKKYL